MSVKIEMDMPSDCYTCKLGTLMLTKEDAKPYIFCGYFGEAIFKYNKRPSICPLKEYK